MGILEDAMLSYLAKQQMNVRHCQELIKRISVYKDLFDDSEKKQLANIEMLLNRKLNYIDNKYNYILNL